MPHKYWLIISYLAVGLGHAAVAQRPNRLSEYSGRERPVVENSVSIEIGGNALAYSFNYDRVLIQTDYYKGTVRIGAGVVPYPNSIKENRTWLFIPVEYNNLFGPENHFLEVSLGTTYSTSIQGANHWITARLGYRLQQFQTGFFLRTGLVLIYIPYANPQAYNYELQNVVLPFPAIALGMSF